VHDVVANGNWIVQHLPDGTPAAKPPLYNWLAALFALAGGESEFVTKLPSLLAALITLLLTWDIGRRLGGPRLGLFAGLLLATSPMFAKHAFFARTDMLLTACVTAQFWAAARVKPLAFWTAAALAMLTKGPIGVLIPALSLSIWWWREGTLRERWRELRVMPGLPLALVPFAAWFAVALGTGGEPVYKQLVLIETVDRFRKSKESRHILYYIPHFLARMAPVSMLASLALTKIRAMAGWWLITTLAIFSLIPSKRADRLFPLLPAACLLAAWVIDTFAVRGTATMLRVIGVLFFSVAVAASVLTLDPLVIACAFVVATAAVTLLASKNPDWIVGAIIMAMLALIAVYQYRVPPSGDTRALPIETRDQR
jgi:4-amino-4-deoxy-L-arabinose transferase-like glycosyltransferase